MKETETPECCCLYCGKKFDRCSSMEGATPEPGDLTCCIGCGCVMAFGDDMRVRPVNDEELRELKADPHVKEMLQRTVTAIRIVNARMPKN